MNISKKDIFGNAIKKTSEETQQKFEALSARLHKAHELSDLEQQDLLSEISVMIVAKD